MTSKIGNCIFSCFEFFVGRMNTTVAHLSILKENAKIDKIKGDGQNQNKSKTQE